jgi:tetraacyldisaccharide 4'-kinase
MQMIINPITLIYKAIVAYRNSQFDQKKNIKHIAKCPVISVGNLSMGGTGKTPFVQLLTRMLLAMDIKPVVIGRGYKKKLKGEVIVSDGQKILSTPENAGDEMYLLANTLPVPVIAHEKKYLAARAAEREFSPDCIVVDDGFQHRYLDRDLDIVIIDENTNSNPYLIPRGRLRELPKSLKRADVIVKNGTFDFAEDIQIEVEDKLVIELNTQLGTPYRLIDKYKIKNQLNEPVLVFSGIGNPLKFEKMLKQENYNIATSKAFGDHVRYTKDKINSLVSTAKKLNIKILVTTEKDSVKLISHLDYFEQNNLELIVIPLEMNISSGSDEFSEKLIKLFA